MPFSKEVTKNVYENQYSTREAKAKHNTLLLIRFYQVENIKSEILFNNIEDTLGRMNIPLMDCKFQCYDEETNMADAKTGVAARINAIESRAHLTHCQAHVLQLAADDTIQSIKIMRGSLGAAFELYKLIKYSIVLNS